jgi:hypothetical protein
MRKQARGGRLDPRRLSKGNVRRLSAAVNRARVPELIA